MITNCGWDTETYLIKAPDNIIPRIVCSSYDAAGDAWVNSTGDGAALYDQLYSMWEQCYDQRLRIIIQNASFDVCVVLRYALENGYDDLYQMIWETLERSLDSEWAGGPVLVSDTIIREKLLNLSSHGSITFGPQGGDLRYNLDVLVRKYFSTDISAAKNDPDAWRLRYSELDGIPTQQWPKAAYDYALDDATWARKIWEAQEARAAQEQLTYRNSPYRTMRSESLQVYSSVCLNMFTATGFTVDRNQVERVAEEISQQLAKIEPNLFDNGILSIQKSGEKKGQYKVNKSVVQQRVKNLYDMIGETPQLTDTGKKQALKGEFKLNDIPLKYIATDGEVMDEIAFIEDGDLVLQNFSLRQELAKLRDAFLPNLCDHRVYTNFDILKETGRTSSYGASEKAGRKPLYRAVSSQQIPRKAGIRECFLATDPRMLISSVDYSALELCSVGQATYTLFGESVHRDKINAGFDLHSYLGAAIAAVSEPELVDHIPLSVTNMDAIYRAFRAKFEYKGEDADALRLKKRAKHFRTLAKPVGLGYPGGLSHNTLVSFAKATYGVEMTSKQAEELKELWFTIYPEMVNYFKWVRNARDGRNSTTDEPWYCYTTPGFNRFRAKATYCATANGRAMQSLAADGAKRAICWVGRACADGLPYDEPYRILNACYGQTFIHDELLVAIPDDALATERAQAISKLMCAAMQIHMPDVRITAEPALMRRWRKEAEPDTTQDRTQAIEAFRLMQVQYGLDMAMQMRQEFTPEGGMRLRPYEDHNPCAVEV